MWKGKSNIKVGCNNDSVISTFMIWCRYTGSEADHSCAGSTFVVGGLISIWHAGLEIFNLIVQDEDD